MERRLSGTLPGILLVGCLVGSCGASPPSPELPDASDPAVAVDPIPRLGELLRRGAQPGQLEPGERREVEELVPLVLPEIAGDLAGHRWRVDYIDLPRADFVAVDLMSGEGEEAPRAAWIHIFYRSPEARPREPYSGSLGPYPARGVPGEYLFVQAGSVEVRAVAEAPELREPGRLEELLERFELETLAGF